MNRILLTAIFSLVTLSTNQSAERLPIYDARIEHKETRISPAESAIMRREVFPAAAKHWQSSYTSGNGSRNTHRPTVIDAAHGSFTRSGARQTAVLYMFDDYAENEALDGIVIIEKNEVVAHLVYDGFWDWGLEALPDINKTGRSKLMVISGKNANGINDDWISLLDFSNEGVRPIGVIPVYHDDAAANYQTKTYRSYKVEVEGGARPTFFRQSFSYEGERQTGKWVESGALKQVNLQKDTVEYELLNLKSGEPK